MNTYKCDICGAMFESAEEKEQFIVCDACKNALHSDREEVGGDGNS